MDLSNFTLATIALDSFGDVTWSAICKYALNFTHWKLIDPWPSFPSRPKVCMFIIWEEGLYILLPNGPWMWSHGASQLEIHWSQISASVPQLQKVYCHAILTITPTVLSQSTGLAVADLMFCFAMFYHIFKVFNCLLEILQQTKFLAKLLTA